MAGQTFRRRDGEASRAMLDSLRAQLPRQQAVEGIDATVAALREAQVSALLAGDLSSAPMLWIGPDPVALAMSAEDLRDWGVADPVTERADAALVRSLALTGAELHFVPAGETAPRQGVGALLRYAAGST